MTAAPRISVRSVSTIDRIAYRAFLAELFGTLVPRVVEMSGQAYAVDDAVEAALDGLDGFLGPDGLLIVAERGGTLVGAVSMKRLRPDAGEIKNLYVRPAARGAGLGRTLTLRLIDEARVLGVSQLLLDTAAFMDTAQRLYAELGFVDIPRYPDNFNPPELEPYLRYMALRLR